MANSCHICGLGSYVPDKILTNHDLEKLVDTSDEWILSRTGIRQRHILESGANASDAAMRPPMLLLQTRGFHLKS